MAACKVSAAEPRDPEFQLPGEQQRRVVRVVRAEKKRRLAKVFKRTGEEYRSLGGVETTWEIYIYRVCSKGAKPEDLKDFATSKVNLDVRD